MMVILQYELKKQWEETYIWAPLGVKYPHFDQKWPYMGSIQIIVLFGLFGIKCKIP